MANAITVDGLSQEAKSYQKQLRFLPYYILGPILESHGISLMQVAGIDTSIEAQRKGNLLRPYVQGAINNKDGIVKFVESELILKTSYISIRDNIKNYTDKKLMNKPEAGTGINKTKEHPFKKLVTSKTVETASEDVLDALFTGIYNDAAVTPSAQDCFNGYEKHIDDAVLNGAISAGNNNLLTTGAIAAPTSETDYAAIDVLVEFVRSASKFLRKNGIFYITTETYLYAVDALEYKYKYKDMDLNAVEAYINKKAKSKVKLIASDHMGIGSRLVLTIPGNFDFGVDTFGDYQFVDVRDPYEDPNEIQFWLQADFGTRIRSFHPKVFHTNDQGLTADPVSGDFTE
jgi:hypothetical protein